jgi:antitoxin component YwqK of YwqJK toxin-antitoxin module
MRKIILFIILISPLTILSQVNRIDSGGLRQGKWQKKYPDGGLIYEGEFKDGKPVGEWTRYHETGQVKAKIRYSDNSDSAYVRLFDKRSSKIAEGYYINEKKTGKWTYYSNGKVISEENFLNGEKDGLSRNFYTSGEILDETEWRNGKKEGKYQAYFKGGKPYMQCKFSNDKRNGLCLTRFRNGRVEMEAYYLDNLRDGEWNFYDEKGDLLYTLKYEKGKILNKDLRDSIDNLEMQQLEKNRRAIPDPEKFMQNPAEYIMRQH